MNFSELYELISSRKKSLPEGSGTTKLMTGGIEKILAKFNEETFEVALAIEHESQDAIALEVSQCYYYLICLCVYLDIPYDEDLFRQKSSDNEISTHELAKQLARQAAHLCHQPGSQHIQEHIQLLFQALHITKTDLHHVFEKL